MRHTGDSPRDCMVALEGPASQGKACRNVLTQGLETAGSRATVLDPEVCSRGHLG